MRIFTSSLLPLFRGLVICSLLAACVTAPVQEMSDARQAMQAARDAGANQNTSKEYLEAQKLMLKAENELDNGEYNQAKSYALSAKQKALKAREKLSSSK